MSSSDSVTSVEEGEDGLGKGVINMPCDGC